jgi:hypothetical protein
MFQFDQGALDGRRRTSERRSHAKTYASYASPEYSKALSLLPTISLLAKTFRSLEGNP